MEFDEQETSPSGKKTMWRETYSEITSTLFTLTGGTGEPGGPFQRRMTIHATKAESAN